jgi:nitrate reductase gamma subunit
MDDSKKCATAMIFMQNSVHVAAIGMIALVVLEDRRIFRHRVRRLRSS